MTRSLLAVAHQNLPTSIRLPNSIACRASEANIQLMQAFRIRPVVLVRNIFDAMVSQLDFHRNGAYLNSYFRGDFLTLDETTQIDPLMRQSCSVVSAIRCLVAACREGRPA